MANKQFIKILDSRIRISTIKRYKPFGEDKLVIRFSSSTRNVESETFSFPSKKDMEDCLVLLDILTLE